MFLDENNTRKSAIWQIWLDSIPSEAQHFLLQAFQKLEE